MSVTKYTASFFQLLVLCKYFNLFVCPPAPSFTSSPRHGSESLIRYGLPLTILGCSFNSLFRLQSHEALWMKNGEILRNVTAWKNVTAWNFPEIAFKSLSVQDKGFYQCGIKVASSEKIILSEGFEVNPPGK